MPIRRKASAAPPPDPSFLDRIGGLPGLAAGGVRAVTGVASAGGFLPGALISGAGELGAEALEGSLFKQDLGRTAARVGAAGAIGLIPFGAVLKAGRPLASAARGALYSGGGEALRESAAGHEIDPGTVAGSAATGGILTGGMSALMKALGIGGRAAGTTKAPLVAKAPLGPKTAKETAQDVVAQRAGKFSERDKRAMEGLQDQFETRLSTKNVKFDTATEQRAADEILRDQRNLAKVEDWLAKKRATAAKETANEQRLAKIEEAITEGKMTPGKAAIGKSLSATTAEGERLGMRTPFKRPRKGGEGVGPEDIETALSGAPSAPGEPPTPPPSIASIFNPPRMAKAPVAGTGAAAEHLARYDAWIAAGASHGDAVTKAKAGLVPNVGAPKPPSAAPAPLATAEPPIAAPAVPSVPSTPSVPVAAVAVTAPRAVYAFDQPGVGPMYNIIGGASDRSTVTAAKLLELGIPVPEEVAAPAASPLMRFFKSRVEAAGQGYGDVKAAKAAGEAVPEEGRALAGRLAQQERIAAGLPAPPRAVKAAEAVPVGPEPAPFNPALPGQIDELSNLLKVQPQAPPVGVPPLTDPIKIIKQLRKNGYTQEQIAAMSQDDVQAALNRMAPAPSPAPGGPRLVKKGPRGSETGEVTPLLLARLGLGAGGALIGAATDPLDNPLLSAAAGGAAGAMLPSIVPMLQRLGAPPEALQGLDQAVTSPEGIKEAAKRIYHTLPQIQRFNYLANFHGLAANVLFGPYGSAVMGAIEKGLSGDPRGWLLLKSLNPKAFVKEVYNSMDDAARLIEAGELGRAENVSIPAGMSLTLKRFLTEPGAASKQLLSEPGHLMTSGDLAARKYIMAAGFSEAEARAMTLTSEPEFRISKAVTNIARSGPLGSLLLPFSRTPANIAEQGAMRLPGIGSIVQSQRAVPDSARTQLVQQLLSTGVAGTTGAVASQLDPETAKIVRRYATNLGGRYSMPAALGFAAGQAVAQGKPVLTTRNLQPALEALPLPTADPFIDWSNFILSPKHPLPPGAVPSGATQRFFPSTPAFLEKPRPTTLRKLGGGPRGIRRRSS